MLGRWTRIWRCWLQDLWGPTPNDYGFVCFGCYWIVERFEQVSKCFEWISQTDLCAFFNFLTNNFCFLVFPKTSLSSECHHGWTSGLWEPSSSLWVFTSWSSTFHHSQPSSRSPTWTPKNGSASSNSQFQSCSSTKLLNTLPEPTSKVSHENLITWCRILNFLKNKNNHFFSFSV